MIRCIPHILADRFNDVPVILRFETYEEFAGTLHTGHPFSPNVHSLRVGSLPESDVDALAVGALPPLDFIMPEPAGREMTLYNLPGFAQHTRVRVSIQMRPGFTRAVKVAASLQLPVRLLLSSPDDAGMNELRETFQIAVHAPTTTEPIEPFAGLVLSAAEGGVTTLWSLLEFDPDEVRYVDENGQEALDPFVKVDPVVTDLPLDDFVNQLNIRLDEAGFCRDCEFREVCAGYFKALDPTHLCGPINVFLREVRDVGLKLRADLESAETN